MREVNAGHTDPAVVAALEPRLIQRSGDCLLRAEPKVGPQLFWGSLVGLFLLTKNDKDLLETQCEFSLKLFSMLRFGTLLVIAATALSGCSIDMEKLKDCKDADGNPLPESVCKKGSPEKSD